MTKLLFVVGFCAAALLAAPALAQSAHDAAGAQATPVSYADLDLAQPADAQTLLRRLRNAAAAACESDQVAHNNARLNRAIARCRDDALAYAVAQLDHPELTRLHAAQRR